LQKEVVFIPKFVHIDRIRSNADIFDFELSKEDMDFLDGLGNRQRSGPDSNNFNF
jgi:diketogulonate reductase-like aldo/keto reductase